MKFCSKCGKELNDEAVVCMGCGCPVETVLTCEDIIPKKPLQPVPIFAICGFALIGLGVITSFLAFLMMFVVTFMGALLGCLAPVMFIAGLVMSIISCVKEKGTASKISLIVSIIGTAISVIFAVGLVIITVWAIISALITILIVPVISLLVGSVGVISTLLGLLLSLFENIEFLAGIYEEIEPFLTILLSLFGYF